MSVNGDPRHEDSSNYTGSYKVDSYVDFFDSYFASIIPWDDKAQYYHFLSRMYAAVGPLHGAILRLSTLLARPLVLGKTATAANKKSLKEFIRVFELNKTIKKIITTMFIHPRVVIAYLPATSIVCECPDCASSTTIDQKYKGTFKILRPRLSQDNDEISAARMSVAVRRAHVAPPPSARIRYVCPTCEKLVDADPDIQNVSDSPGTIRILEPAYTVVDKNPVGKETVRFSPFEYNGIIAFDVPDLRYGDIAGIPWDMVIAYASRGEEVVTISPSYVTVLRFEELVLSNGEVDLPQILPVIDDIMSVSVLKRGNEALAVSKISPMYLVSPSDAPQGSNSSRYQLVNEKIYQKFIIEQVRAHEEGDIGRIAYSPMPVNAQALFGDGRRFLALQEVVSYMRFALGSLGINAGVIEGGVTISSDPLSLEVLKGLSNIVQDGLIPFLKTIWKKQANVTGVKVPGAVVDELYMESVTDMPGAYSSQVYNGLTQNGMAPMDRVYREVGLDMPYADILEKIREENAIRMNSDLLEQNTSAEIQRTNMLQQLEKQQEQGSVDVSFASDMIRQQAEDIVNNQLSQMTDGERKSHFNQLMKQDYVLYAVTVSMWRDYKQSMNSQNAGDSAGE